MTIKTEYISNIKPPKNTLVVYDGHMGGEEAAKAGTVNEPLDEVDCITYLAASCRTTPSLRLQKCSAVGLDSMVQSSTTVEPMGAPINCCCSATDGGTVLVKTHVSR